MLHAALVAMLVLGIAGRSPPKSNPFFDEAKSNPFGDEVGGKPNPFDEGGSKPNPFGGGDPKRNPFWHFCEV